MVESNNEAERLTRIEEMIEALQRESATIKRVTAKLADVVQVVPLMALRPVRQSPPTKRRR
jgi:hypothetical protein